MESYRNESFDQSSTRNIALSFEGGADENSTKFRQSGRVESVVSVIHAALQETGHEAIAKGLAIACRT